MKKFLVAIFSLTLVGCGSDEPSGPAGPKTYYYVINESRSGQWSADQTTWNMTVTADVATKGDVPAVNAPVQFYLTNVEGETMVLEQAKTALSNSLGLATVTFRIPAHEPYLYVRSAGIVMCPSRIKHATVEALYADPSWNPPPGTTFEEASSCWNIPEIPQPQ